MMSPANIFTDADYLVPRSYKRIAEADWSAGYAYAFIEPGTPSRLRGGDILPFSVVPKATVSSPTPMQSWEEKRYKHLYEKKREDALLLADKKLAKEWATEGYWDVGIPDTLVDIHFP